MNSNNPYYWHASPDEIEKDVQLKKEYHQMIHAKIAEMRRIGLSRVSCNEIFAAKEAAQKALSVKAEYRQNVQAKIEKMRSKNYSQL